MAYCIGCMNEIPEESKECCPFCGFVRSSYQPGDGLLAPEACMDQRYIIGRALRTDDSGTSYLAWDTVMDRRVIFRQLAVSAAQKPAAQTEFDFKRYERRERFVITYQRLALLDVSSLPSVYTCRAQGEDAYAVWEYVSGMTLADFLLQAGPQPFETVKSQLLPIIVALKLMHDQHIFHGNLDAGCIYLTDKTLLLCDVTGIAGIASEEKAEKADALAFVRILVAMLFGKPSVEELPSGAELEQLIRSRGVPEETTSYLCGVLKNDVAAAVTADQLLERVYQCSGGIAVGKPRTVPLPPQYLLDMAQAAGVTVTQLVTSLVG